jgi:replicative DNA helicase
MAYVIAVSNQKGGVGKSTLATNIATACARRSKKALLADRPFVQSVDVETEAIVVRGRVLLERNRFLQVCFNEETGTTAFALIEDQQRIWGVDYDDLRGGHIHSVVNTGISI